jgi:hypothetical protein
MKLQSISEKRDIKRRFDVKFAISKEYIGYSPLIRECGQAENVSKQQEAQQIAY